MRFLVKYRHVITAVVACILFAFLIYIGVRTKDIKNVNLKNSVYAGNAFGTAIKKTLYAQDKSELGDVNDAIDKELKALENELSVRVADSEVTLLNRNYEAGGKYELSDELLSYLNAEMDLYESTDGAFNPCIRPLTNLWGIEDGETKIPSEESIKKALGYCNVDNMELYDGGIIFREPGMMIDFGATGKGLACDKVREILKQSKAEGAVVSIGGSICVYGDKGDNKPWHIGVQDPRKEDGEVLGIVDVDGTVTVSTSGDYEKYFEQDGVRYHHIIDPATGYPADSGLMSVTVICENGLQSDGLSTACFVMGLDKGMAYAKEHNIDMIFVTTDKKVYVTDGLKKKFRLTADDYTLEQYKGK